MAFTQSFYTSYLYPKIGASLPWYTFHSASHFLINWQVSCHQFQALPNYRLLLFPKLTANQNHQANFKKEHVYVCVHMFSGCISELIFQRATSKIHLWLLLLSWYSSLALPPLTELKPSFGEEQWHFMNQICIIFYHYSPIVHLL